MNSSNKQPQKTPYQPLGDQLKQLRESRSESLAEVSGAVEIEIEALSQIECGKDRPSEDILLLLISHFAVKEDLATKLWELAGFDQTQLPVANMVNDGSGATQPAVM